MRRRPIMCSITRVQPAAIAAIALCILSCGMAAAVEVNDTQTWGATNLSHDTLTIGPAGNLTINGRTDLDDGTIILNGGVFTINGDFHFADTSADQNPEEIYLYAGTMTVTYTESYRDRGAVVYVGSGEMITGQVSNGNQYDPSNTTYWDIRPLEGYGPVQIEDVGGDRKRIWAPPLNAQVEFESAASGQLETVGTTEATVVVKRADPGRTYMVSYSVTGGTAAGGGTDYTLDAGTLTFAAGQTAAGIAIAVVDDGLDEQDETVIIELSNPTGNNLVLGDITRHTYTIIDPRPSVGFNSAESRVEEEAGSADVTVSLSAAAEVTVDYAVSGGTATRDTDYAVADGTLTFTAGQTTANIPIAIVADELDEDNETVIMSLSNASGAKLGQAVHTLTITEDRPFLRGAFYFRSDSDPSARVGPHTDVMVRLGEGENKLIFRRNKGYLPVWYSEEAGEQDLPVEVARGGCETTVNWYSRVEVIETSPARAVVHWRYATNCSRTSMGIRDWVDEYFTVYPDGACIRAIKNAAGTSYSQWNGMAPVLRNLQLLAEGVADLPASWLNPATLVLNSGDYSDEGFDETQRAYILQTDVTCSPTALNCTLDTSGGKSVHNPAIVVKNWGDAGASVAVDGSEPALYYTGYAPDMYGDHLVVWLGIESTAPVSVTISPEGGSGLFAGRARPPVHSYSFNDSPPLPLGSPEPGPFGAYYTNLRFNDVFDSEFRHGDHADVVVQFDDNAHRMVFWRGTNYQPHWAGDTSQTPQNPHVGQGIGIPGLPYSCWYGTEFLERRGEEWGIPRYLEPMSDQQCRYTHVRIISSNPARAIVQWRYAPCHIDYRCNNDGGDPWGDWVNEYYIIYPDAISVRHLIGWSRRTGGSDDENPHFEYHEAMPITNPGTVPEDNIHLNAVSATNYSGSKRDWVWSSSCGGGPSSFDDISGRPIMVFRMKGSTVPITITDGNPTLDPISGLPDCRLFNHYDDWPAWPDKHRSFYKQPNPVPPQYDIWWDDDMSTCCYRYFWKYCPAHCSTYHVNWRSWVHIQDKRKEKIMLFGMYDAGEAANINNLIPLGRSWEYAPGITVTSAGFSGGSYDKTQRAYRLSRDSQQAGLLEFTVNASSNSPVYNPCFVIDGWDDKVRLSVNGQDLEPGADFRQGIEESADGTASLVVWVKYESTSPASITITRDVAPDLDRDGDIDWLDMKILVANWLAFQEGCQSLAGDVTGDCMVDFDDFAVLTALWMGNP